METKSIESNNSFGRTSSVMKPLGGLLHLGFTSQEPVIIYSLCECVEGEISILLVIPLIGIQFLECSLFFLLETINPFRSQNSATPFPFSKSCKPPPLPPQVFCFSSYQIFYFPFPVLLAIPPLSIRGVQLWGDPGPIFNPPKE